MTRETVDKYRVEVTISVFVMVVLFLFGTAYKLGADQTKIETKIEQNTKEIEKCKDKAEEQSKVNNVVAGTLIEIKESLKHIKSSVDEIKQDGKANKKP